MKNIYRPLVVTLETSLSSRRFSICPPAQFHAPANQYEEGQRKTKKKTGNGNKTQRAGSLHRPTRKGSGGWPTVL
jgi:hypothetical protein